MMVMIYFPFLRAYENSMGVEVEEPVTETPSVSSESNTEQQTATATSAASAEASDEFSDFTDFM